jgi:hypothetical protein
MQEKNLLSIDVEIEIRDKMFTIKFDGIHLNKFLQYGIKIDCFSIHFFKYSRKIINRMKASEFKESSNLMRKHANRR